jgi:(E)-4-hydroxy-3-methylbut-2-enyl-diphosphate synthase
VQGRKEAEACYKIRDQLFKDRCGQTQVHLRWEPLKPHCSRRYDVPICADIHFQPTVAMMACEAFEKVSPRIQPLCYLTPTLSFPRCPSDPHQPRQLCGWSQEL